MIRQVMLQGFFGFREIRPGEIATACVGWLGYIVALTGYCIVHQLVVRTTPLDIHGSFTWALREWGFWILLTMLVFNLLRPHRSAGLRLVRQLPLLLVFVLALSLTCRVVMDSFGADRGIASTLVVHLPRHLAALLVVLGIWYFFLRQPGPAGLNGGDGGDTARDGGSGSAQREHLMVDRGSGKKLLAFRQIESLTAAGNYVEVYSGGETYLIRATMKQLQATLPDSLFLRSHRSHIVNIREIERIAPGNHTLQMRSGRRLPLSKSYRGQLYRYRLNSDSRSEQGER